MKASDLIQELIELIAEYGDKEILASYDGDHKANVEGSEYYEAGDCFRTLE